VDDGAPATASRRRDDEAGSVWRGASAEIDALFGRRGLSRRRFLRLSTGGVLLLGAGALLPAGCRRYPAPSEPLVFLNSMEYAVVNAAAAQILGLTPEDVEHIDIGLFVDRFVADFDRDIRRQVRLMLRIFEHGTHVFDLMRGRFTALSPGEKERYLEGWMDSSIGARRVVFRALKALSALGYYSRPESWAPLGYQGPWLGRVAADVAPSTLVLGPWSSVPRGGDGGPVASPASGGR
jgi:PAS domain-containing protein